MELLLDHNAQIDLPVDVSNVNYQCLLAMYKTVSLMYVCIPHICIHNSCRMTLVSQRWVLPLKKAM